MERLTIEEIIAHCERNTERYERTKSREQFETEDMSSWNMKEYWEHRQVAEWLKELQAFKDKQEQGLLIELPYPIETEHIYFADENDMDVHKLDAEKIEVHMMSISKKIMYTIDCYEFFIEDFGKIVFLTEAEAEEALARMKGE